MQNCRMDQAHPKIRDDKLAYNKDHIEVNFGLTLYNDMGQLYAFHGNSNLCTKYSAEMDFIYTLSLC